MTTHFVKIDNTDPRITYVPVLGPGPFHGQGFSNAIGASEDPATQGPIFNNTLEVGMFEDTSVVFPFSALSISVYGSIRPMLKDFAPLTTTTYSLIGFNLEGIPANVPFKASNVTNPINNVLFFTQSGMTTDLNYTLTINVTASSQDMPFYLDYIALELPGPDPNAPASTSSSSSSSTSSSALPSTSSTSTETSTTSSASASSTSGIAAPVVAKASNRSTNVGAIVGGTIGGVAVLALALLALLFWYKRRPKASLEYGYGSAAQKDVPPHIIPYVAPSDVGSMQQTSDVSYGQSPISTIPSQKMLALGIAGRRGSHDLSAAGSSTYGADHKDPALFQSSSRPQTPAQGSSDVGSGSSSGSAVVQPVVEAPPPVAPSAPRPRVEETPPVYTPA